MRSRTGASFLGAGLGAGLMFFLDPDRGPRRRALFRDKMNWAGRTSRDAVGATRRDLRNRLRGTAAELRSRLSPAQANDRVLCERVRAELGRVVSHPRAIHVAAVDGRVVLTGDALASEMPWIAGVVNNVRGVLDVENRLLAHANADRVPSLQGTSGGPGHGSAWLRSGWSPTAMAACAGAAAIAATVVMRRG
jgi:hypothetical protein